MPTLEELIEEQKYTKISDIEVISKWFCDNNREEDGLELITKLNKSKVDKLSKILNNARMWPPQCLMFI